MGLLFVFALLGTLAHASSPLPLPLSLKDAVHFALEHSPTFDTAKKTQALRKLEYKSSIAQMLPSADVAATHGLQNNIPVGANSTLLTPNPAAPWYSSLTNSKIADLSRDLASISYLKARDSLTSKS